MTKLKDVNIFAVHYKPHSDILEKNSCYTDIWAGRNNSKESSVLLGDDTGENISSKNNFYSELTGIFWAWKNCDADVMGFCHYRRFFTNSSLPMLNQLKNIAYYTIGLGKKRHGLIYTKDIDFWENKILSKKEVLEILESYDAIMPKRRKLKYTVREHYRRYHYIEDIEILNTLLKQYYPEYYHTFDKVLNQNRLFANNMFILKRDKFEELMNWLFDIIFKLEETFDMNKYKDYQERIFGFLSERLITLWIIHNEINYKEIPLIYFKRFKN